MLERRRRFLNWVAEVATFGVGTGALAAGETCLLCSSPLSLPSFSVPPSPVTRELQSRQPWPIALVRPDGGCAVIFLRVCEYEGVVM